MSSSRPTRCIIVFNFRRLVRESYDELPASDQFVVRFHESIHGIFLDTVLDESEASGLPLVRTGLVEEEVEL